MSRGPLNVDVKNNGEDVITVAVGRRGEKDAPYVPIDTEQAVFLRDLLNWALTDHDTNGHFEEWLSRQAFGDFVDDTQTQLDQGAVIIPLHPQKDEPA